MARLFNLKVFEMTLGGSATTPTAVYSDQSLEATFGSAELLTVQFIIEGGAQYRWFFCAIACGIRSGF